MIIPTLDFWKVFKKTPGALSASEALAIINISGEAPNGSWIELGTHKGKSAMAAMYGGKNKSVAFNLVEPEFENTEWLQKAIFNISAATNCEKGHLFPHADYSYNVIPKQAPYSYVFSDAGSHSDDIPMQEVKMLEDRIIQGGIIAFHDVFSQFVKQTEAYEYLLSTGKYEKIEINWQEIFDYVSEHNLEDGNNSWHQYPELPHPPNFVGALRRK